MEINNFKEYIKDNDLLYELIKNPKLSKDVLENNLFWTYIYDISIIYGESKTFEIFKLLYKNNYNINLLNTNMFRMFDYDIFGVEFFDMLFKYVIDNEKNEKEFLNLITFILTNKCQCINYNLVESLLNSKYKNIVIDNFYKILDNSYYLFDIKELIKNDKRLLDMFNNYINNNPNNMIYELLIKGFDKNLEIIKQEKIFNTAKELIDEVLRREGLKYSNIDFLGMGATSYVVSIGSKVLKFGQERKTFKLDNNKRFLKPILRTEIDSILSDKKLGIIEITEKVNINNVDAEDAYMIYKELRDQGYIWIDSRPENVGRLIKKNKIYYNEIKPTKEAINYNTENDEELNEGELVILDNDYIFHENDKEYKSRYKDEFDEYELRYLEELRRNKK